jgi:hypothetical protein
MLFWGFSAYVKCELSCILETNFSVHIIRKGMDWWYQPWSQIFFVLEDTWEFGGRLPCHHWLSFLSKTVLAPSTTLEKKNGFKLGSRQIQTCIICLKCNFVTFYEPQRLPWWNGTKSLRESKKWNNMNLLQRATLNIHFPQVQGFLGCWMQFISQPCLP